jgi:recombination protein RecR
LDSFADAVQNLKKVTVMCSTCFTIAEENPCWICGDPQRDKTTICVVEQPLDVLAIEKTNKYKGVYHVLNGRIDPLNNIGPDEIYVRPLIDRVQKDLSIKEVILATNPTLEGDATSMYLNRELRIRNQELRITRIGRGLPVGADIEYADDITLQRAMDGRQEFSS